MSAETKWTPGPWFVGPVQRQTRIIGYATGTVARVHGSSAETMDSDAALIAAAPDLYAALETMLRMEDEGGISAMRPTAVVNAFRAARHAIARARGEQP